MIDAKTLMQTNEAFKILIQQIRKKTYRQTQLKKTQDQLQSEIDSLNTFKDYFLKEVNTNLKANEQEYLKELFLSSNRQNVF